jgi:glycosyltransferase involved in cell wall biosynthesis
MSNANNLRVAFLYPSVELGAYWLPVLKEFKKIFRQTVFYTGHVWPGFDSQSTDTDVIKLIGKSGRFAKQTNVAAGYDRGFIYASPRIISHLLRFKPHVIFASYFSIWTFIAIFFKPIGRWKIVIAYEGSSSNVDFKDSKFRLFLRQVISRFVDAFVTNSSAGQDYLTDLIKVQKKDIFTRPYMVPDPQTMFKSTGSSKIEDVQMQCPVFLYVGRLDRRKGIHFLLMACTILHKQGYRDYKLLIVGDGPQREELDILSQSNGIEEHVEWAGWVTYENLGTYFRNADIFVFPSQEDTWGMVVLEAMAFSKPILCSKWAGAAEMVQEGENGYIFDPHHPETLAKIMRRFIDNQKLIVSMGQKSEQLISQHNPQAAAKFLADITYSVANQ